MPFYSFAGSLCVLWFILWIIFAYDSPSKHPRLSDYERAYIAKNNSAASHVEDSKVRNANH